jgi:hypothetical protein
VTLGGNSATGINENSMYSVVVRPRGGGTAATRVRFVAIDVADIRPSEDLWQYEYRVVGRRFLSDHGFSIFFDPLLYDELEDPPPAVAASWDVQVLQPDAQGSQAGLYDALALTVNDHLKVKKSGQLAGESSVVAVQGLNRFPVFQKIGTARRARGRRPRPVRSTGSWASRRRCCESAIARASLRREIA